MNQKFYYLRDCNNRPIVTVCLMRKKGNYARGVSICSLKDNPNKKTGRNIAKGMATKALKRKMNSEMMARAEVWAVLEDFLTPDDWGLVESWNYKSCFNPGLTEYEGHILFPEDKQ